MIDYFLFQENGEIKFKALQYAMLITCFVEVLGAIFFFITANHILRDRSNAEKIVAGKTFIICVLKKKSVFNWFLRKIF